MFGIKKLLFSALAMIILPLHANAAFIDLDGGSPAFDITIETSGTDVVGAAGVFDAKTVTGLSLFNPTGTTFNFFNSASDFDFSFLVTPVYGTSGSESVRFYTSGSSVEFQIGEVFDPVSGEDHRVNYPGDINGVPQTVAFNNVNVSTISAVPEPATYAMFLAGLGLMGFVSRRKA